MQSFANPDRTAKVGLNKLSTPPLSYGVMYILTHLSVDHECERWTDSTRGNASIHYVPWQMSMKLW